MGYRLGSQLVAVICHAQHQNWTLTSHSVFGAVMVVGAVVEEDEHQPFEHCFGVAVSLELAFAAAELEAVGSDSAQHCYVLAVQLPLDQGH